jgi:glycosyltransferase involved in cell wall biosynthesis
MVHEGETGLKFKYADINDFRKKIIYMFEHMDDAKKMGEKGYELIETKYSPETHYKALMNVFDGALRNTK